MNVQLTKQKALLEGLIIGDGFERNKHIYLYVKKSDMDYFNNKLFIKNNPKKVDFKREYGDVYTLPNIKNSLGYRARRSLNNDCLNFFLNNPCKAGFFLKGLFSANASVTNSVKLKQTSEKLIEQVSRLLHLLEINHKIRKEKGYVRTVLIDEKQNMVKTFQYKPLFVVEIKNNSSSDFRKKIGFLQGYKREKLNNLVFKKKGTK